MNDNQKEAKEIINNWVENSDLYEQLQHAGILLGINAKESKACERVLEAVMELYILINELE